MTATEFLNNIKKLNTLINSTQEVIDSMIYPSSIDYSKESSYCSSRINREEEKRINRQGLIELLDGYLDKLNKYQHIVIKMIVSDKISATSKIILEHRYLLDKSWKETAIILGYDEVYIKRKLNKILLSDCEKVSYLYVNLENWKKEVTKSYEKLLKVTKSTLISYIWRAKLIIVKL